MVRVITLLCGENDYELMKKVAQLKRSFEGAAERYDATELTKEGLADIFAGQTLFASKRLIFIDTPSGCADLWQNLADWAARLSDDTELVLIEPKPDKRTGSYKWLKKHAKVQEFLPLEQRDTRGILDWIETYAKKAGVALTAAQSRRLADRVGANQWELAHAIDKLGLVGEISDQWIDDITEASTSENVFTLFELVLNGDSGRVSDMLANLRLTEDPYRLLGLLVAQVLQLLTLTYGDADSQRVAADMGAKSAYPYQKLSSYASRLSKAQASAAVRLFATADLRLKQSDADPWLVLESTLTQMASQVRR